MIFNPNSTFNSLQGFCFPSTVALPNVKCINLQVNLTSTGDNDLYTVPTGKRAYIANFVVFNGNAGSSTVIPEIKISGTYYALGAQTSVSASVAGSILLQSPYVAEAGEIVAVNISAQPCVVYAAIFEFDNTANIFSKKLTSLINGNNTLYTCATGKTALLCTRAAGLAPTANSVVGFYNNTGGSLTVHVNVVKSGGSPGTTNQASSNATATSGTSTFAALLPIPITIGSGDFISINSGSASATQFAWVTAIEF